MSGTTATSHSSAEKRLSYRFVKRSADLLFSLFALPFFFIIYLTVAVIIKFTDKGSILYKNVRVGKNGKMFYMYKFRTMKENSEDLLTAEDLAEYKKEYKLANDPRVTKFGVFLRKTSLDELPQLLNIIKNDMSLIGPRPVLQEETYLYGADREKLLSVKPGLTGYWQAYARNSVGYHDGKRQRMELYYVKNQSVRLDIKIFFATIKRVLSGNGVY